MVIKFTNLRARWDWPKSPARSRPGQGRHPDRLGDPRGAVRAGAGRRRVIEREVVVANRLGLHARAAARFVHLANLYGARISVARDSARADGKSILGLLTLAAAKGSRLRLAADGDDAAEPRSARSLVRGRFGEDD